MSANGSKIGYPANSRRPDANKIQTALSVPTPLHVGSVS